MSQLALHGGNKIRTKAWPKWPIVGECELEQMTETIKSGIWGYNGPKERKFAREFAKYIGVEYAIRLQMVRYPSKLLWKLWELDLAMK